ELVVGFAQLLLGALARVGQIAGEKRDRHEDAQAQERAPVQRHESPVGHEVTLEQERREHRGGQSRASPPYQEPSMIATKNNEKWLGSARHGRRFASPRARPTRRMAIA